MSIIQEQYKSKTKGNLYVFQTPTSNLKTLEILDALEVAAGGAPTMHKAFPMVLEEVVIKPQDLTVDSKEFKGEGGVNELVEVCSQAIRFLNNPRGVGSKTADEVSDKTDK